jgi:hypothetical protein
MTAAIAVTVVVTENFDIASPSCAVSAVPYIIQIDGQA